MKFISYLQQAQIAHDSFLCVGLDPNPQQFPSDIQSKGAVSDQIEIFCKAIVEATAEQACAFKPQIAYFAAYGAEKALENVIAYIKQYAPQVPVILDAKRGDIGSTAQQYAKEAFERYQADAVTLSPFMGWDTITPYLSYADKGLFLLCKTSNLGSHDFQNQVLAQVKNQPTLYEYIAQKTQQAYEQQQSIGLVVGATYPEEIAKVRQHAPDVPLLIPGVGAQGGDEHATLQAARHGNGINIINSSRAILYASAKNDFAEQAYQVAQATRLRLNAAAK